MYNSENIVPHIFIVQYINLGLIILILISLMIMYRNFSRVIFSRVEKFLTIQKLRRLRFLYYNLFKMSYCQTQKLVNKSEFYIFEISGLDYDFNFTVISIDLEEVGLISCSC